MKNRFRLINSIILIGYETNKYCHFIYYSCNAQQKINNAECYKNSWAKWIENELPKSICVQNEEMIYYITNDFDYNIDGVNDIAIKVGKKERKNGDIRKLVIYQKVNDSTFVKFRELDKVYPLWFENYDPNVKLENQQLNALKQQYEMGNPLQELELIENRIILNLNADVGYKYIVTFTYSSEKKDWLLTNTIEFDLYDNVKVPYKKYGIGTSISDFSYIDYLYGEY